LEGDGVRGAEPAAEDGPYFFLSYSHFFRGDDRDAEDQDVWVHRLFRDLCGYVSNFSGLPANRVGFMDRELRSGDEWPWRLSWNLANCRVFVPLYSRRYFQSVHCGKEWAAFRNRGRSGSAHASGHPETIIPALWSPVRKDQFPQAAQSIHFEPEEFGEAYADYGFFAIMKLTRFKDDYDWAALRLARHICTVAEQTQVLPGPAMDYDSLSNAFEEGALADMAGDKRLRIIVAAPHLGDLPPRRSVTSYYGQAASDWNPFAPESVEPLAAYARGLARYLGFRPEVVSLYEQEDDLLSGDGPAAGPAVLLVDPWEVTRPRCQRILAGLDELDKPWIQVVVVWNGRDAEMTMAEADLQAALDAAMPITRSERVRMTALHAFRGVPALKDLPPVLGDSMRHAARQYLKYAHPPGGAASGGPGRGSVPPATTPPTSQERADG
jgi:FxsC-like protein